MKPHVLQEGNAEDKRKKRVLVVDDSTVVRKFLGRILARLGFEVHLASNGQEGLQILKQDLFDFDSVTCSWPCLLEWIWFDSSLPGKPRRALVHVNTSLVSQRTLQEPTREKASPLE